MKRFFAVPLLAVAIASWAGDTPAPIAFVGEVSDTQCAFNVHSTANSHDEMIKTGIMGSTAEACARACVNKNRGKYVLLTPSKKEIYIVEPAETVEKFAGKKVKIHGSLDAQSKKLKVDRIEIFNK